MRAGLTPRGITELFNILDRDSGKYTFSVSCYMLELYQDDLADLLVQQQSKGPHKVSTGLTLFSFETPEMLLTVMDMPYHAYVAIVSKLCTCRHLLNTQLVSCCMRLYEFPLDHEQTAAFTLLHAALFLCVHFRNFLKCATLDHNTLMHQLHLGGRMPPLQ